MSGVAEIACHKDDDRCHECGFLACICYRDDDYQDDDDGMDDCGRMPDGTCMLAGTEHCDWDCP